MDEPKVPVVIDGKQRFQTLDRVPDECPVCHRSCLPTKWGDELFIYKEDKTILEIVFKCPHRKCSQLFIVLYASAQPITPREVTTFYLGAYIPSSPKPKRFSAQVCQASTLFPEIYNQAAEAERCKLHHICGPGYRKALEFLVKDYLINVKRVDRDAVENSFLGTCIRDNLSESNVAKSAERAAWLGNDETHYVRKWTDKDIADLKTLIILTVRWIETEMLTDQYEQDMPATQR